MDRRSSLKAALDRTEPWDVVVVGGGATGVGCALDAAVRGYSVLLLEQHDLGKATSSRSTKLVHGGVRYLRQGNISLVREALRERGILLRNAPHVVHEQAFVVPCYSISQKLFYGIGLKVYDLLAGSRSLGSSRMLSAKGTADLLPNLELNGLVGGVLYFDGQFDDARLLIDIASTATANGAAIINYAKVTSFIKNDARKITGVRFKDVETGETFEVATRSVINATGVFCDSVRQMSSDAAKPLLTFAQGTHLVFDRKFLPSETAVMIPKTRDGRVLFCIPWHDHVLVGTTDTPVASAILEPEAFDSEIEFILETVGKYLTKKPTRADILSVFSGIRPLVSNSATKHTSALSRSHDFFIDESGLITIAGGKWTTYRRMAEDAVNMAAEIGGLPNVACRTSEIVIESSGNRTGEPLLPGIPITREDVVRAVRDEMAVTLEDVLARRTRILFLDVRTAIEISREVGVIMANELGRDHAWVEDQVTQFNEIAVKYLPRQNAGRY